MFLRFYVDGHVLGPWPIMKTSLKRVSRIESLSIKNSRQDIYDFW